MKVQWNYSSMKPPRNHHCLITNWSTLKMKISKIYLAILGQQHCNLYLQIPVSYCSGSKILVSVKKNSTVTFFYEVKLEIQPSYCPLSFSQANTDITVILSQDTGTPEIKCTHSRLLHLRVRSFFFCTGSLTKIFNQSICFLTSASRWLLRNNPNTLAAGWNLQQGGNIYWKWPNFSFMQCLTGEKIIQGFAWDGVTRNIRVCLKIIC